MSQSSDAELEYPLGPRGYKRLFDPETRRILSLTHYTVLGEEKAKARLRTAAKYPGGYEGAFWQADNELNLEVVPGTKVFANYGKHNRVSVEPLEGALHALSFDFGHSDATSVHCSMITPKQIQVYHEHYLEGHTVEVHKERLVRALLSRWPLFDRWYASLGDAIFNQFLAVGDKSGPGYKAQYARMPFPIRIRNPIEDQQRKRILADKEAMEAILDSYLAVRKRCCHRVFMNSDTHCSVCKQELESIAGMVIDPSCQFAHRQIPAQVIDESGRRRRIANHAVDDLVYLALKAWTLRAIAPEPEPKPDPWWRPKRQQPGPTNEYYGSNEHVLAVMK